MKITEEQQKMLDRMQEKYGSYGSAKEEDIPKRNIPEYWMKRMKRNIYFDAHHSYLYVLRARILRGRGERWVSDAKNNSKSN